MEWIVRDEWRRKTKTLGTEKCKNIDSLYTNKKNSLRKKFNFLKPGKFPDA